MKSVDNFELIGKYLEFKSKDDFYFLQIIKRPKENEGLKEGKGNRTRMIKTYYIKSHEHFMNIKDEVAKLCELFNARAYIKMNYCDASKIALQMLKQVSDYILSDNVSGVKNAYNSCCGKFSGNDRNRKYWIIDFDGEEVNEIEKVSYIIDYLCEPLNNEGKVVTLIPTKNGIHLLTKPFNVLRLQEHLPDFNREDIKKEALTLLYM